MKKIFLLISIGITSVAIGQINPKYIDNYTNFHFNEYVRFKKMILPLDTLSSAADSSVALKGGIFYQKLAGVWGAISSGLDSTIMASKLWTYDRLDSLNAAIRADFPASYTDADARAAISLTTTASSGAATYNSSTGVFNIPNYGSANFYNSDGTLSGARTVNANSNNLTFDNLGTFAVKRSSVNRIFASSTATYIASPDGLTFIQAANTGISVFAGPTLNNGRLAVGDNTASLGIGSSYTAGLTVTPTLTTLKNTTGGLNLQASLSDSIRVIHDNFSSDTTNFKLQARHVVSGALVDTYWPVSGGGTPALTQYRLAVGDASNQLSSNAAITGNMLLGSDANGVPIALTPTVTEANYISGLTSNAQTQINAKVTGSIADDQIAYGNGTSLTGSNNFKWDNTLLTINSTASASTIEQVLKWTVSDNATDYFSIENSTGSDGVWAPMFKGHGETSSRTPLYFLAETTSGADVGSTSVMSFDARRTSAAITTRPLFAFKNFASDEMVISPSGIVTVTGGVNVGTYTNVTSGITGMAVGASTRLFLYRVGTQQITLDGTYMNTGANMAIGWTSASQPGTANPDLIIKRDGAAGLLAQVNSTNAQEFRIYNTDNGANDEFASIGYQNSTNVFQIASEAVGTGTVRDIEIVSGAANTRITKLAGTGTEMVTADASGNLSRQAIPTGGVTTLAAVGSTANANGATISGTTLNLEPASGSFPGVVSTGSQTFNGQKTWLSTQIFSGAIQTNTTTSSANFWVSTGNNGTSGTPGTDLELAGATTIGARVWSRGSTAGTSSPNSANSNWIFGNSKWTEASSGTHPLFANVAIKSAGVDNGTATTTDATTLYVEGPPIGTATITNPVTSLWVASGTSRFGGPVQLFGYTVATLPTGVQGMTAYVTDATAPTYLGTLTGGGSVVVPVFYDGTNWVSH